MTKIQTTQYVELSYDAQTHTFSWEFFSSSRRLDEEGIKETLSHIFTTMRNFLPKYVLANDTYNYCLFSYNIQDWIAQVTIESLLFCKTKKFAVVNPNIESMEVALIQTVEKAKRIAPKIEIQMFESVEEAELWLRG